MDSDYRVDLLEEYAKSKDKDLRDQLFEEFLPLSKSVARRFVGRGVELDDLEQVAAMALLKALKRFEPERGFRFVTYAVPTITGDVRNYLRDKGSSMRMPRDKRQKLYQMQQERDRFSQENLREPTAAELAEAMCVTPDELLLLLSVRQQGEMVYMDAPVGDEEASTLGAFLGEPEEGFAQVENSEWMDWVLSKVSESEAQLLVLRYQEQLGQRETAKRMGISQMQVSRVERRILSRLRAIEQNGAS